MSLPIATVTAFCTHGAQVITGTPFRSVDNLPVARMGDLVSCPTHGINAIVNVTVIQQTANMPVAHVTALAACGAMIITASPNCYVG